MFEISVLSFSLIVLSVGYSLEWNMDRRLEEEKLRFILDNAFSPPTTPVCQSGFHIPVPVVSHKHFQGSWQSVQSFSFAGLYMVL